MKQKKSSTVYLNYPDYSIKTGIFPGNKKISTKENLTYYWYASNKIMETKGGYDGKILNGSFTSFYLSNNLKEKGSFKNGLKNGTWIAWYENGKIKEIITWKKGVKTGCYKNYDSNGNLLSETVYKNDRLNGLYTKYAEGKIVSNRKYSNGEEITMELKEPAAKDATPKKGIKGVSSNFKKFVNDKIKPIFKKKEKNQGKKKSPESNSDIKP